MTERVDDYDYEYPPEAVAQVPAVRREDARLLRVRRFGDVEGEGMVSEWGAWLTAGDLVVMNEVWVRPARLSGVRADTGGRVSLLVLSANGRRADLLAGTRGTLTVGETIEVDGDRWRLSAVGDEGRVSIEVEQGRDVEALLADVGRMPLPPYIRRDPVSDERDGFDRERYQTTYARPPQGSPVTGTAIAAPTAGLHFTPALLADLQARGVETAWLVLEVGEATFRPLRGESLDEHDMGEEWFTIPEESARRFAATRAAGGRVVAVGTTVVRALESAVAEDGRSLQPGRQSTRLFIRPGHDFRAVDALFTNFHQPRSSLIVLVSAFAGGDTIRAAYRHAIGAGFRLFSYGDAMFMADAFQCGDPDR